MEETTEERLTKNIGRTLVNFSKTLNHLCDRINDIEEKIDYLSDKFDIDYKECAFCKNECKKLNEAPCNNCLNHCNFEKKI